jgi:hypothetical protein
MAVRVSALVALSLFLLAHCKPSVGSSCEKGESRCLDGQRALVCQAGEYIETACRGKKGCRLEPAGTACDIHGNDTGDACSTDDEGASACVDPKTLVACRKGAYVRVPCRGPKGCAEEGGHTLCDATVAEVGEACAEDGKKACSSDGKRVLACASGKMAPKYECRGARGCVSQGGKLDCDLSIAALGDACDAKLEGHVACDAEKRNIVRCGSGKFVQDEACKKGTSCHSEGGSTKCEKPAK